MELVIANSQTLSSEFISYLVSLIQSLILSSHINFQALNQYFLHEFNHVTVESILSLAASNLLVLDYETYIIITIDPNIFIQGTLYNLKDLCRLINYGNLDVSGTNLFTDVFDYMGSQINSIYYQYFFEG